MYQKLSLYINTPESTRYHIESSGFQIACSDPGQHHIMLDPAIINRVQVVVTKIQPNTTLIIEKIVYDELELHDWNSWSSFQKEDGSRVHTYGYMDSAGIYTFKIRYGALTHKYMTYFRTRCRG